MEWAPQYGNEVFPRLPVVLAVVLSAGWLVGCRPSRGRSMALAGLGLALVLAVAQITVRCLFWGAVMHGVADTGGDLFIVLLDPIESLVQGVALILVAGTRGVPGAIALAGFAVAIGALVFAVPHAGGQPATD